MKSFCLNFFYNKKTALRVTSLLIISSFCLFSLNAQVKLRIESGVILEADRDVLGLFVNIEPKVRISEKNTIGLRFGTVINPQKFKIIDSNYQSFVDDSDDIIVISFIPTFDTYLNLKKYRPYVGIGVGYYLFSSLDPSARKSGSKDILKASTNNQIGFLIRGGYEFSKTTLGLEYNFIPNVDINSPNNQTIAIVNYSYFGVSIGFEIGHREALRK